jgi:hypothetical protein
MVIAYYTELYLYVPRGDGEYNKPVGFKIICLWKVRYSGYVVTPWIWKKPEVSEEYLTTIFRVEE